jgi:para-aminobenzoate synthetase / 4-amino-4-deoxychorismate lyase
MDQWARLPTQFHSLASENTGSVLLQTERFDTANYRSFLFLRPISTISVTKLEDIPGLFCEIETALASGHHVAGFLGYECGYHFEDFRGVILEKSELPLAWFGIYPKPIVFDHATNQIQDHALKATFADLSGSREATPDILIKDVALQISQTDYVSSIGRILDYIAAGDTYQVNFTDRVEIPVHFESITAFKSLLLQQPVAYSALLNLREGQILSLSPELFFRIEQGIITTRPMKGTMPRGLDHVDDIVAALRLKKDEKNRSEHIMIVDLLRNDLGRICTMGSIQVQDLFTIESYRTLLQMTSTITGTLRQGLRYYEIFRSLFPCGSITGAPKIRTMQIIHELERTQRGVYTGAIGFISPDGSAAFNVAIRTLAMSRGKAVMGVGGGIVADSDPIQEYHECLLKASFLSRKHRNFELLETILWDKHLVRLDLHLQRLESSSYYFEFPFDRDALISKLLHVCEELPTDEQYRIRLLLSATGNARITTSPLTIASSSLRVRFADQIVSSADVFLRHKTTHRQFYDDELAKAQVQGFDEVVFMNERGEITGGAISNIFIRKGDRLITPFLACGVLPGVFRSFLLDTAADTEEGVLTGPDLREAKEIYLCNSLRGMRLVDRFEFEVTTSAF